MTNIQPDWIAVDWGTSNLRLWAMTKTGDVLTAKSSDKGMAALSKGEFEPLLLGLIDEWLTDAVLPVLACGMVGARQGWQEAPYDPVPAVPSQSRIKVVTKDPRIDVQIVAGVCQHQPANVMRGEETQIAGYIADKAGFAGSICLPGTHCKWAAIADGEIKDFQTAMTGELYALIAKQSVLRFSMGEWHQETFMHTLRECYQQPEKAISSLFEIRARQLVAQDNYGRARLSGILIGVELAGAKAYWQGKEVAIIGAQPLAQHYADGINVLGGKAIIEDVSELTLKGLTQVYKESF